MELLADVLIGMAVLYLALLLVFGVLAALGVIAVVIGSVLKKRQSGS